MIIIRQDKNLGLILTLKIIALSHEMNIWSVYYAM